jgi:transcription termination factor Rho
MKKITGFLNISRKYPPTLWEIPFDKSRNFYKIPQNLVKKFGLVSGARLCCQVEGKTLKKIDTICGLEPAEFRNRKSFSSLQPVNPSQKFNLGESAPIALRIMDLFTPIGKGTRGLIVSPPRAGKTTLLEQLASKLESANPKQKVVALLVDERPEEVTSFQMNTQATVFHSSLDKGSHLHVLLSNFILNHIKVEVECGNDIILLIDSLTRMGRAYNRSERNSGSRTMSGGLGSGALEIPRKLFGMARATNKGGSCTILATILKDTGSRMDEMIFQEFKGTGNCELILDRSLAEERIFPAINLRESGTRKDELLLPATDLEKINILRRSLLKLTPVAQIETLQNKMQKYENNRELLSAFM